MRETHKTLLNKHMKTQNINEVPMSMYRFGSKNDGFHTTANFYFKDGGVKYYVDNVAVNLGYIKIRNSRTGVSRIVILDSELRNSRYGQTYFFEFN